MGYQWSSYCIGLILQQFWGIKPMDSSELIIHTVAQQIYACCYFRDSLVFMAGTKTVDLYNFLEGVKMMSFGWNLELAPNTVRIVGVEGDVVRLFLQGKSGVILILRCMVGDGRMLEEGRYQIDMVGFARVALDVYQLAAEGAPVKKMKGMFRAIRYPNCIEERSIVEGKVEARWEMEEGQDFSDVTVMVNVVAEGREWMFVAEEGAVIKRISLNKAKNEKEAAIQKLRIPCDKNVKIVLDLMPFKNCQAMLSMRQDQLCVIDLFRMQIVRYMNFSYPRMTRMVGSGAMALVGRDVVGVLAVEGQKETRRQRVYTSSMIMDVDVCGQEGVVGVLQEGKVFFYPL